MAYSDRDYLTSETLANYLGYRGKTKRGRINAAMAWVKKTGVKKVWRGKVWLVHPDEVDRQLEGMPKSA